MSVLPNPTKQNSRKGGAMMTSLECPCGLFKETNDLSWSEVKNWKMICQWFCGVFPNVDRESTGTFFFALRFMAGFGGLPMEPLM